MTPVQKNSPKGFTLLEMTIALFILMLVLGMASRLTGNVLADEEIRQTNNKLQAFARSARYQAALENQPWEIVLHANSWLLRPVSSNSKEKKESPANPLVYNLPEQVSWQVKLGGSKEWSSPEEMIWTFAPNGLCAPNRFRLKRDQSWIEVSFNPLTANPQNEEFYLP